MSGAKTVWIDGFEVEVGTPVHKRLTAVRETAAKKAAKGDGSDGVQSDGPVDYKKLKQPALKELLDERQIEYPSGAVKNADLIALLEDDDAKAAKGDGSDGE